MSDVFGRIAELNSRFHFCENINVSTLSDRVTGHENMPLSSLVIGIKANISVVKQAWTVGIGARSGEMSKTDADVVNSLRMSGATLLSRLKMDEGALGAATDNPHFGRCENPAWPDHTAGGSSGGSSAAVASGAVDAALGTDTMGSVRIPAAYCGVYGLKLGHQSVPMDGVFPLAPSLDALGILARDTDNLLRVINVLHPEAKETPEVSGWFQTTPSLLSGCTHEVQVFYRSCHKAMWDIFGQAASMPPLDLPALRGDSFLLTEVEAVQSLGTEPGLSKNLRRMIDYGRRVDPQNVVQLRARMSKTCQLLHNAMGMDHVIISPTVAEPAFAHGARPPANQADFTVLANIAECPAIAIPKQGAKPPVSVQLMGPKGSEWRLIALAQELLARV